MSDGDDLAPGDRPIEIERAVRDAVAAVCDPEYPEVSIAELGILESVECRWPGGEAGRETSLEVEIGLVPTMLGCPALDVIRTDVTTAAQAACEGLQELGGEVSIRVEFLAEPVWTTARIAPSAAGFLKREYSIGVRASGIETCCPICGGSELVHESDFGPTPCRTVEWCPDCRNPVELIGRVSIDRLGARSQPVHS